jgi:hypothetical protein
MCAMRASHSCAAPTPTNIPTTYHLRGHRSALPTPRPDLHVSLSNPDSPISEQSNPIHLHRYPYRSGPIIRWHGRWLPDPPSSPSSLRRLNFWLVILLPTRLPPSSPSLNRALRLSFYLSLLYPSSYTPAIFVARLQLPPINQLNFCSPPPPPLPLPFNKTVATT